MDEILANSTALSVFLKAGAFAIFTCVALYVNLRPRW